MIGAWSEYAIAYMYVIAIGTFLLFGLPMVIWPLRWAKIFQWRIPVETHLTIYFGRCLGGVICVLAAFAIVSTGNIVILSFFYKLILCNFLAMILIHVYGAIKKIQPLPETLEIIYWCVLFVITLLFYPTPA